ncbi:MAG TPA: hypothetical protein VLB68_00250 [Pyrinomonadaceae bacterium]|nr:hypothetical protein [Pyrinomonadaceae bacterium]
MKKLKLIAISVCLLSGLLFAMPHSVQPAPMPQGGSHSPKNPPMPPPPSPTPSTEAAQTSTSSSLVAKFMKILIG